VFETGEKSENVFNCLHTRIDKFNNVYKTEDIISGKENPKIIAKCVKTNHGYSIPQLGL
jgi:hypothetical protein